MDSKISPFISRLDATAKDTEDLLDRLLSATPADGELSRPARLVKAMRYSSLGGGKRFRPFLVVECAALFEVPRQHALMAGAALECVHCYSLVHDDLPAMDNDDLRRGQPTAHRAFDEATAILAGDGLLTFAFDILSRLQTHPDPAVRVELVSALARASGVGGMVGGQMLDLAAEGLGSATPLQRQALERFGSAVGQAFQIADDLLDLEGDPALVGKSTGKDAVAGKATMVDILGPAGAKGRLKELVAEAEHALASFGPGADILIEGARFVAERHA